MSGVRNRAASSAGFESSSALVPIALEIVPARIARSRAISEIRGFRAVSGGRIEKSVENLRGK